MMLSDFFADCVLMDKTTTADGYGGVKEVWTDGASVKIGIARTSTTEARLAYKAGTKELFTLVFPVTLTLGLNDRVKRLSDGKVFRVTSDCMDMTTPKMATVQYRQVDAEVIA